MLYWDIDFRGMVFAPGGAGIERYFIKANVLFCVPKENQKWFSRW